jgi:hypothetical protein
VGGYPPLGPQRQLFAAVTPDSQRYALGSPPLPCPMIVYLRIAPNRYLPYSIEGGPQHATGMQGRYHLCVILEPPERRPRPTNMKFFVPLTDVPHKIGVAAVLGAVVALAAACGSQSGTGGAASTGASKPASSLTISVTAARGAVPRHWTLTCEPAGGTHPNPQTACITLDHVKDPFAPVPSGVMCSMIASGPQTASITGIWDGKHVTATYSRDNGCQTERWNKISKVLGQVNPGGPMIPATSSTPSS